MKINLIHKELNDKEKKINPRLVVLGERNSALDGGDIGQYIEGFEKTSKKKLTLNQVMDIKKNMQRNQSVNSLM